MSKGDDLEGWVFLFVENRLHLKIDGRHAESELLAYNDTEQGKAEIARQWAEYDRRGCPFMSYQNPSPEAEPAAVVEGRA